MASRPVSNRCSSAISRFATQRCSHPRSAATARPYHSYDHPPPRGPFSTTEEALLSSAYKHVPSHGFTQEALNRGAKDAGFIDISPSVLTDGPFSLIRYHLLTQRNALATCSQKLFPPESESGKQVEAGEKAVRLTWERLLANKDVVHQWQDALAIMAQPTYVPQALKELALLSDEIWFLAGDISVDPSWYTKRASLSMMYSTSELFMTNDKSPGFSETQNFLHRRWDEMKSVGAVWGSLGQWAGFTVNAGINVLRSKGVAI